MNKYHRIEVFMCDWCGGLYHLEELAADCQHGE